jgi:hypothetical protein
MGPGTLRWLRGLDSNQGLSGYEGVGSAGAGERKRPQP